MSNLEKYKQDLDKLIHNGDELLSMLMADIHPNIGKSEHKKIIDNLPNFKENYQNWYSESLALIKLLLPDRLKNFIDLYEIPKNRKATKYLELGDYKIEDYLRGLLVKQGVTEITGPKAAIPLFEQQLNILKAGKRRFESSLFDIKSVLQADLFDSELEAALELNKKGFFRAAGAIAGVVLEHHLQQVCKNHNILPVSKHSTISTYNDLLKDNSIIDIPSWRHIQLLGDLRNRCDHKKEQEPTSEHIKDLILGVEKICKTVF